MQIVACQMTVDLFDREQNDCIPEISESVGAASFLPIAHKADLNFFV